MKRRIPQSGDEWFHRAACGTSPDSTARLLRSNVSHQQRRFTAQVKQVISRLSALWYLDDRAYAARWVETTLARRPMGRDRLKSELMAKGLGETLADDAIVEGLDGLDEETLARRALRLKAAAAARPASAPCLSYDSGVSGRD